MEEYAILGGGGMATELAECMLSEGKKVAGYYAPSEDALLNSIIPYLGDERVSFNSNLLYMVASGLMDIREKMINFIKSNSLKSGTFISNRAYVASSAIFGEGTILFPFVVVDSFVNISDYVFVNFHASLGHHTFVGKNVVISPGARINGNCKIGNNVSIGANSALVPGTILEDDVEIGILTYPRRKVRAGRFILSEPGRALR